MTDESDSDGGGDDNGEEGRTFRRDDLGRRVAAHSDEEFLELLEREGPMSTREIADALDYHIETARYRLERLEDRGDIMRAGTRENVWFLSE